MRHSLKASRARTAAWGLLLGVLGGSGLARGQEAAEAPLDNPEWEKNTPLEDILKMDIAAPSKLPKSAADTPAIASIVPREQIDSYGWFSINDVLLKQPGFFLGHTYERDVIGTRGFPEGWNNNHLLLLIDGVPYNDVDSGGVYSWEQSLLYFAKSVEIVRGPGSALYGSNAVNGTIAINTLSSARRLTAGEGTQYNTSARLRAGDGATQALDVVGVVDNPNFLTVLGYSRSQSNGNFYSIPDGSGRTDASGVLQKFPVSDRRESNYFFAKIEGQKALPGFSLQFHDRSSDTPTGIGWFFLSPDVGNLVKIENQYLTLAYRTPQPEGLAQEFVAQYQRNRFVEFIRVIPADPVTAPGGVDEHVDTTLHQLFLRAQETYSAWKPVTFIGGAEYTLSLSRGDQIHDLSADPATNAPFPNGLTPVGPDYGLSVNHPISNVALFAEGVTQRFLRNIFSVTAGLRYDTKFFNYGDPNAPNSTSGSRRLEQLSPHLALIAHATDDLRFKLLAGRGFRSPALGELFGANTYLASGNPSALKPETITNATAAVDWSLNRSVTWRANVFYNRFNDLIGFDSNNALSNQFSRTTGGLETELVAETSLGSMGTLSGFANYSFVHLYAEQASDPTVVVGAAGVLPYAPMHSAKAGLLWEYGRFSLSAQGLYQGTVGRRPSDVTGLSEGNRPNGIPSWVTFDAYAQVQVTHWLKLGIQSTNLLAAGGELVQPGAYPFDYHIQGRRVLGVLELHL